MDKGTNLTNPNEQSNCIRSLRMKTIDMGAPIFATCKARPPPSFSFGPPHPPPEPEPKKFKSAGTQGEMVKNFTVGQKRQVSGLVRLEDRSSQVRLKQQLGFRSLAGFFYFETRSSGSGPCLFFCFFLVLGFQSLAFFFLALGFRSLAVSIFFPQLTRRLAWRISA